jgi:hypothetical protein
MASSKAIRGGISNIHTRTGPRACTCAGNGNQAVMVIPPQDLVIAIYAGNDSDAPAVGW